MWHLFLWNCKTLCHVFDNVLLRKKLIMWEWFKCVFIHLQQKLIVITLKCLKLQLHLRQTKVEQWISDHGFMFLGTHQVMLMKTNVLNKERHENGSIVEWGVCLTVSMRASPPSIMSLIRWKISAEWMKAAVMSGPPGNRGCQQSDTPTSCPQQAAAALIYYVSETLSFKMRSTETVKL